MLAKLKFEIRALLEIKRGERKHGQVPQRFLGKRKVEIPLFKQTRPTEEKAIDMEDTVKSMERMMTELIGGHCVCACVCVCELVDRCRDNRVIVLVTLLHLINVSIATIHLLMDVILTFLLELLCM